MCWITKIKVIITEIFGISESVVTNKAHFTEDLGVDSLDMYELIIEIEKEFRINIPAEEAEKITTVESLINYIDRRLDK